MGDAAIDIKPIYWVFESVPGQPPKFIVKREKITQEMTLELKNVVCGHIVVEIEWKDIPS